MVLFNEAETRRLLELYAELQADPANVTANGVLLKQSAREELTDRMNCSYERGRGWSEGQISVKIKNMRNEFAEYKWLDAQPGFREDGSRLSDEWWADVKRQRPKAHVFKGKLPWPFAARMEQVFGGAVVKQSRQVVTATQQGAATGQEEGQDGEAALPVQEHLRGQSSDEGGALPVSVQHKRKRNDSSAASSQGREERTAVALGVNGTSDRGRLLLRSVEKTAVAAAGMARGVQDLVTMLQEKAVQCHSLQQQVAESTQESAVASRQLVEERRTLASMSRSLEHGARAMADMAHGYRQVIEQFVKESDVARQQQHED